MPNWCGNRLVVRGDSASIAAFWEDNKESMEDAEDETYLEELSFKRAVPLLDNEDRDERGEKWGTSQDAYEVGVSETDGMLEYDILTAWSPPTKWLATVAEKNPALEFRLDYTEPGENFAGNVEYRGGAVVSEQQFAADDERAIGWYE